MVSLSSEDKAKVMTALDESFVVFSQMEHTFNKERFKRKWVQSTAESLSLGRTTRVIDNLVTTANKSKVISFFNLLQYKVFQH